MRSEGEQLRSDLGSSLRRGSGGEVRTGRGHWWLVGFGGAASQTESAMGCYGRAGRDSAVLVGHVCVGACMCVLRGFQEVR